MFHTISKEKLIREMDACELEDLVIANKWKDTKSSYYAWLCWRAYTQLTGKDIFSVVNQEANV